MDEGPQRANHIDQGKTELPVRDERRGVDRMAFRSEYAERQDRIDLMPTIKIKAINPTKLKSQAFKQNILDELEAVGNDIRRDYEKTVATWEKKPKFEVEISSSGSKHKADIFTTNEIYGYVDYGTPKRDIVPKNAKVLRFPGTFSAKTIPGVISSLKGHSGPPIIYTSIVRDHEIKARGFSKAIQQKWIEVFYKRMKLAMGKAAKESGHDP